MNAPLVITFVGPDRAGLVSAVSDAVAAHGGTWLESRLARLAGQFAGVVRADVPAEQAAALEAALAALPGLSLIVSKGGGEARQPKRRLRLELLGLDRPGIVRDATGALAGSGSISSSSRPTCARRRSAASRCFTPRRCWRRRESVEFDAVRAALEDLAGEFTAEASGLTLAAD